MEEHAVYRVLMVEDDRGIAQAVQTQGELWNLQVRQVQDLRHVMEEFAAFDPHLVLLDIGLPCFEPKGAFYVFPDIRGTGLTSDEFCERFLMEEKVAVISGSAFGPGGEGFIRCCYATSMKDIAEALTRMDNFLTNLRKKQAREG